jgi:hypothetical protein
MDGDSPSDMVMMWVKQEETINNHHILIIMDDEYQVMRKYTIILMDD